ncbi:MAG: oxidoreductase [Burkholderiaceae bacterium]|nr:oxidoreductase [Burkholderiaceae bacterium]
MAEQNKRIIKDRAIIADDWLLLRPNVSALVSPSVGALPSEVSIPTGKVIVPLAVWLAQKEALSARADIGVWLASDERPEALKDDLARLPLIAVDFPKFSDGRGYSIAFLLRERLGYAGELRAIGDVLRDQLFYLARVGFNAFDVRADRSLEDALAGLTDFSVRYQTSSDEKEPLFRRVHRPGEVP